MTVGGVEIVAIAPEPTEAERAAIIAAIEKLSDKIWPQLAPAASPPWRYASRPWRARKTYGGWH